jgi:hypothetical protein
VEELEAEVLFRGERAQAGVRTGENRRGFGAEELRSEADPAAHERQVQGDMVTVDPPGPRVHAGGVAEDPQEVALLRAQVDRRAG